MLGDKTDKLFFNPVFAKLCEVHQKNTCVYVSVGINAECLGSIRSEFFCALHELLGTRAQNVVAKLCMVQFGYIPKNNEIAIQVYDLAILRKEGCDK